MDRWLWVLASAAFVLFTSGCSKSEPAPAVAEAAPQVEAQTAAAEGSPEQTVHQFLEAVRTGEKEQAEGLLSDLARKKTAEMDMVVAPSGSPTARFEIKGVEYVTEAQDGAHVASSWTDLDEQGVPHTDEIFWIVRREPQGWRIAGMATKLFPDQAPLVLNFEDPENMLKAQELAQQEMERRDAAQLQAQRPDHSDKTQLR